MLTILAWGAVGVVILAATMLIVAGLVDAALDDD